MFKKIRKYLIILMAVVLVATFAAITVDACTLQGGVSDGFYPQGGGFYAYGAETWAYCADSPYWCYVYTTAGNSWDSGDPGGWDNDTARASVYQSGILQEEFQYYFITDAGYGCYC